MDLQTERRLEQFVRILGLPCIRISERMEFAYAQMHLLIEVVERRLVLSFVWIVDTAFRDDALKRLLSRSNPQRTHGVVLRAFASGSHLVLSCAFPNHTVVSDWLAIHGTMRRIAEAHAGEVT
jgi:type III secretion system chaperone SycN